MLHTRKLAGLVTVIITCVMIAGCENPADKVPAASVSPATETKADPAAAGGDYYGFNDDGSKVGFVGSKVTGSHEGGFKNFVGEFRVADAKLADSGTKVVIDATSLWSDNERLTGHLKSADFFDVGKFPTATFVLSKVEPSEKSATLTGELTLHGITKTISFPATVHVSGDQVRLAADFSINRLDFEMHYPGKADDLIRKEVVIKLDVNGKPGRADFSSVEKATAE